MNASVIFVLLISFLTVVSAFPAVDNPNSNGLFGEESLPSPVTDERGLRFRRVTCDLLSVSVPFGSLNHSACAAHCLAKRKGFRGGRCKDGVCHCRK